MKPYLFIYLLFPVEGHWQLVYYGTHRPVNCILYSGICIDMVVSYQSIAERLCQCSAEQYPRFVYSPTLWPISGRQLLCCVGANQTDCL